jgi:hypothetical protein
MPRRRYGKELRYPLYQAEYNALNKIQRSTNRNSGPGKT